jgi:hypothetical protein
VTWRQELEAFKAENPNVEITDESPWPMEKPAEAEAKPAEEPAKPAEGEAAEVEAKPAEAEVAGSEDYSLDEPAAALTPQALNDLLKGDAALKAAIEANPAAKGALFKMAREHAELSQFKGIFPNAEGAKFARETANRTVALRTQVQMAETPEAMSKAFDSFSQEFAVIDPATGKQAVDATGAPVFADDYYAFNEHIVDRYADGTLAEVEARIKENKYASEAERERDNDLKLALSIIKDDLHPRSETAADPDLSSLSPDVRAQVEDRLKEAKRIESENATKAAGAKKQSREQIRTDGNQKFFADAGKRTFDQVDKIIEGLRKAGAVIPDWQLNTPLPGSQISAFKNAVGSEIENYLKGDPFESNKQFQLELQYIANPTPENLQARVAAFDQMLQSRDETGKSLLNRVVTKLVRKYGADVKGAAEAGRVAEPPAASREPAQGGPVRPHAMTSDEAWKAAEGQLAKENKEWNSLGQSERLSMVFARQRELLTAKR